MLYFRLYGFWALIQVNEKAIKYEDFKVMFM